MCTRNSSWYIHIHIIMHPIYSKTWGKERNHHFHHLYLSNDSWESLCDAKACYCEDVKASPSMYFREIYQSWVKDPIDPTRLKRRRTLEWIQEKLGLLGWWGESILMIIHSKSPTESWSFNRLFGRLMFQFPGQAQEIPWKNNSSSNGSQAESLNGLGWASPWVTPSCCVYRIRWTTSYFHAFQIPSLQVAESIWRFEGNAFKIQKRIDHGQHLARRKVHTVRKTPNGH